MTLEQTKETLQRLLAGPLESRGFEHVRDLVFVRRVSDREDGIELATFVDRNGMTCVSLAVTMSFDALVGVLQEQAERRPTLAMPGHLLHESGRYEDWAIPKGSDGERIRDQILTEVERYALPFFERYRNLKPVRESLEPESPEKWVVLDPQDRFATLVAIEWVEGNREQAQSRLAKALAELQSRPQKKRSCLEQLQRRLNTQAMQ